MIINSQNLAVLTQSVRGLFRDAWKSFSAESAQAKIATTIPSNTRENLYPFLGNFPSLQKWLGDRIIKNLKQNDYSLANEPYEATVAMLTEDLRRDQYGVYNSVFQDAGMSAALWPDEMVFAAAKAGPASLCYDGQFFFDTDHPVGAGVKSNYDSTSAGDGSLWMLLDTRRPMKPFIFQQEMAPRLVAMDKVDDEHVFSAREIRYGVEAWGAAGYGLWQTAFGSKNTINATNLDAALAAMRSLENDEGQKLNINPNLLVCSTGRQAEAEAVIDMKLISGGENNRWYKKVDLLVTPYLDV